MERNKENAYVVFGLAGASVLLYFNSFWNAFAFDDFHTLLENLFVKDLRYLPMFLKGYYTSLTEIPKGMFRPLLMLTFSFNYFFSGQSPLGFHIVNTLIHFLNGIMLYAVLRTLKKDIPSGLAFLVSLLFLAHPLNTEAVVYISCRSDLLVTFLILAAFLSYVRKRYWLALLVYFLALLTKETALVFGFLVFSYDMLCAPGSDSASERRNRYRAYAAILVITVAYWWYRSVIFSTGIKDTLLAPSRNPIRGLIKNAFIQLGVSAFYLKLFIWPHPLNLHHASVETSTVDTPVVAILLFALLIIVYGIFAARKRQPLLSFGLAWYGIGLLPKFYAVLNFPAMEHHSYLPSIGLYFVLAVLGQPLYVRFRRKFWIIACGILGIYTLLVWHRNYEWRNSVSLYKAAIERNPRSAVAYNNLGIEFSREGFSEAAESAFKKALSLSGVLEVQLNSRINLAHIYANRTQFDKALEQLDLAFHREPRYHQTYQALGVIYTQMDKDDKAEEAWKEGLGYNPQASGLIENLGVLCLKRQRYKEAKRYFQQLIQLVPDHPLAYFYLGQIFEKENDLPSAIKAYKKSISLNPSFALAQYVLGTLYAQQQDTRALWHLKEAVRIKPQFGQAHNNLAVLYSLMVPPRLDLARYHAKKASSLGYEVNEEFLKNIGISAARKE